LLAKKRIRAGLPCPPVLCLAGLSAGRSSEDRPYPIGGLCHQVALNILLLNG